MSAQAPFSNPSQADATTRDINLDLEHVECLKKKLFECQEMLNTHLFFEWELNPYRIFVAGIEPRLDEHSAVPLTGPLHKQLQSNREEIASAKLWR